MHLFLFALYREPIKEDDEYDGYTPPTLKDYSGSDQQYIRTETDPFNGEISLNPKSVDEKIKDLKYNLAIALNNGGKIQINK